LVRRWCGRFGNVTRPSANRPLKRTRKGKPLKETKDTDAIFANVAAVREQARDDPATLEISMDTKAEVALGEYVRGGESPDVGRR